MTITTSIFDVALTTDALIRAYLGGDGKVNEEPVHDSTKDIDADDWNTIVAGLAEAVTKIKTSSTYFVTATSEATINAAFGQLLHVNAPGGGSIVTLPTATASDINKRIAIKCATGSAGSVTVDAYGDESVADGSITLAASDCVELICSAVGTWIIISLYVAPVA